MTQARSERKVPTRRMDFAESFDDVPRHFAAEGDLVASHVIAALSSLFPDGEDFFVRSVRHYRDQVTEPELKRQVAGFIGQEAVHGREHRELNEHLATIGYPTKFFEWLTRKGLAIRERLLPPAANLAATAALEHFTATLAELVLSSEETRDYFGHPAVRDLFVWHALEESEHKAVAFDVYKAVGGGERLRVFTMKLFRIIFVMAMVSQVTVSLFLDRATYNPRRLYRSLKKLRHSAVMQPAIWHQLRDYDRHDFHPDDRDTTALVEQWRTELFGPEGTLNDKLAKAGAA
jgi:predicted metal-dependent hydrolase